MGAGFVEALAAACPLLSSVLLDRCDLADAGVTCPQSSFSPLHRVMVRRGCFFVVLSSCASLWHAASTAAGSTPRCMCALRVQVARCQGLEPALPLQPSTPPKQPAVRAPHGPAHGQPRVDGSLAVFDLLQGSTRVLHSL